MDTHKRKFRPLAGGDFAKWLRQEVAERVRNLVCGTLYGTIETPEERAALIDRYDDVLLDAILAAYPPLVLARPLLRPVVRYLLAQGIARAAQNLEEYCAIDA